MTLNSTPLIVTTAMISILGSGLLANGSEAVKDAVIAEQRATLASATEGKGFGPQAPRDIDAVAGTNPRIFEKAPPHAQMNLCNIHFHEGAEHKGGEFTTYAGNGDGEGYNSGYRFDGQLTAEELRPYDCPVCGGTHSRLEVGDTIEVHYVFSTAQVEPGPTLGSCLSEAISNPQLRVEAQVYVLVNDATAADFVELTNVAMVDGLYQAPNIPSDTGRPIEYPGSTTGPGYNLKGSPFQVSWSVRPKVKKVDIATVATWLEGNRFDEDHAHGVRNLVVNPALLSQIGE